MAIWTKLCLNPDALLNGNYLHDKAVLFCLAEVYLRKRDELGTYTSRIFGFITRQPDKTVKMNAATELQEGIVSNEDYAKWKKHLDKLDPLTVYAIKNRTLGKITTIWDKLEEKFLSARKEGGGKLVSALR